MPKVVSGLGMVDFVQTGKHEVIDDKGKREEKKPTTQTPEAKEAIKQAEAQSAEEIKPEEDDGLEPDDKDLADRARSRISKKHREMKQAEALAQKLKADLEDTEVFSKSQYQRAQAAEEEAARLKAELEGLRTQPQAKPGLKAPDENDPQFMVEGKFQLKKYEEARDVYVKAQFRAELEAERATAEQAKIIETFKARCEAARVEFKDFDEVVGSANVPVPHYIQQYMLRNEYGARLNYHFAKESKEFERISKLEPVDAIAEIGEIVGDWKRAKVQKEPSNVVPIKPSAPAPIIPLSGSGSPGVNSDPAKMSPKELLAYTREREAARKRRG